jgi:hypothetical protein
MNLIKPRSKLEVIFHFLSLREVDSGNKVNMEIKMATLSWQLQEDVRTATYHLPRARAQERVIIKQPAAVDCHRSPFNRHRFPDGRRIKMSPK